MSAPLRITEAPADVPATAIGRLAKADLSSVVMAWAPSSSTTAGVASEVLRGLGKNHDANGKARHGLDDVSLVPIWLTARRTQTLVVAAPQHASIDNLLDLASMCAASPTVLVLAVDHGYGTRLTADLRSALPEVGTWPGVTEAAAAPETAGDNAWNPGAPSVLPDADFLSFYATARRTVSPELFASFDSLYRDALRRTLDWIEQSGVDDLTEEATRSAMAALIDEQVTFDEVTTVITAVPGGVLPVRVVPQDRSARTAERTTAVPECPHHRCHLASSPRVKPGDVVCDGDRVIVDSDQALRAGMVTSSVVSSVTGRMRLRARTSRPR